MKWIISHSDFFCPALPCLRQSYTWCNNALVDIFVPNINCRAKRLILTSNATQGVTIESLGKIMMVHSLGMDRGDMPDWPTWPHGHSLAKLGLYYIYSAKVSRWHFTALTWISSPVKTWIHVVMIYCFASLHHAIGYSPCQSRSAGLAEEPRYLHYFHLDFTEPSRFLIVSVCPQVVCWLLVDRTLLVIFVEYSWMRKAILNVEVYLDDDSSWCQNSSMTQPWRCIGSIWLPTHLIEELTTYS